MKPVVELAGFCLAMNVFAAGLAFFYGGWGSAEAHVHVVVVVVLAILGSSIGRTWILSTSGYGAGLVALSMWASVTPPKAGDVEWICRSAMATSVAWYITALTQPTIQFVWLHVTMAGAAYAVASDPRGRVIIDKIIDSRMGKKATPAAAHWMRSFWKDEM